MRKVVFLDIDTQYDFARPRGKLYVKNAELLIPRIKRLVAAADSCAIPIISTLDWHRRDDPEFKEFPPHCVRFTTGAAKVEESLAKKTRQMFVTKYFIDIFLKSRLKKLLKPFTEVFLYGIALDYCIKTGALGCRRLDKKTFLIADATVAISPEAGKQARRLLKKKGVIMINTDALIRRLSPCRKKSDR